MSNAPNALVVEDDSHLRQLFSAQLKLIGYNVSCVENASEALKLLEDEQRFALLLTDVVLPGEMNGQELSECVKRQSPNTVALYTSGYPAAILARMGIAALDGEKLIQKPFRLGDLKKAIARTGEDATPSVRASVSGKVKRRLSQSPQAKPPTHSH